jgi:hypothetical protein
METEGTLFLDDDSLQQVAPALGAFVIDFNVLDHSLTSTLDNLLDGPARTFGGVLFGFLQPLAISTRIDFLKVVVRAWKTKGLEIDAVDLFKDLGYVVSRRNRLIHDWWEISGRYDPIDDANLVRTIRTRTGKEDQVEHFTHEDLLRLREIIRNLVERLERLEQDLDWSKLPDGKWKLIDEVGFISSSEAFTRAEFSDGKLTSLNTHLDDHEWLATQVQKTISDSIEGARKFGDIKKRLDDLKDA